MTEATFQSKAGEQDGRLNAYETRVKSIEILGGLEPGDTSDATFSSILAQSDSHSRRALDSAVANDVEKDGTATKGALLGAFVTGVSTRTATHQGIVDAASAAEPFGLGVILRPGVYEIEQNLTINVPVVFDGAIIKPAAGVTVILAAGFTSQRVQVFDHSAGGIVAPRMVSTNHPAWWGPVNTADDSPAWKAAAEAMYVSEVRHFTVPQGNSRIWLVDFTGITVVSDRESRILPVTALAGPGTPLNGTGYMIKVRSTTSITGGQWRSEGISGIVIILYTGSRSYVRDAYIFPTGANTIGIHCISESGGSITPVLDNIFIQGLSDPNTPGTPGFPSAPMGTGILADSADGRMTKITIAYLKTGIRITRASWVLEDVHIWNCTENGLELYFAVYARVTNSYFENNGLWGVHVDRSSRMYMDTTRFWDNGLLAGGAGGGMKMTSEGGNFMEDSRIDAIFDDNLGTAIWVERSNRNDITARICSTLVENGGTARGSTGVRVQSNCYANTVHIRGGTNAVLGATATGPAVTGSVLTNNAGSQNTIEFYNRSQTVGASTIGPSTVKSQLCAISVGAAHKMKIEATVIANDTSAKDLVVQVRTNNTNAGGWYSVDSSAAARTISNASNSNNTTVPLLGEPQAVRVVGYVEMVNAGQITLNCGVATDDGTPVAIQYADMKVTRVG